MKSHELASVKWSQPKGLELTDYALRSISNEAKFKGLLMNCTSVASFRSP